MTDQDRINLIVQNRASDPDILFLLRQIDVRNAVLGNLMEEYAWLPTDCQSLFEAYSISHAIELAKLDIGEAGEFREGRMALAPASAEDVAATCRPDELRSLRDVERGLGKWIRNHSELG